MVNCNVGFTCKFKAPVVSFPVTCKDPFVLDTVDGLNKVSTLFDVDDVETWRGREAVIGRLAGGISDIFAIVDPSHNKSPLVSWVRLFIWLDVLTNGTDEY